VSLLITPLKDSYVAKFDSKGDLVFALNIGGWRDDSGNGIATDSNGNAWATGTFQRSIDIDGDKINDLISNGSKDSYVAKFDSDGDLVFAFQIGGKMDDEGFGIATDSNGNVWATGSFNGNIDIDGDGNNDLISNGRRDSYVAKFSSDGDLVKVFQIGGREDDSGYGIAPDNNGNAWATGGFWGSIDIDGDGNNDLTNRTSWDSYVIKFSGNFAPTDLNLSNNSINENVTANTVVGTFSTTDPDTGDTFTYQLVAGTGDTDNAAFTIVGDQLQINSSPDFETQSSYSILVQSTDTEGLSYSENLTININNVNEGPTNPNPGDGATDPGDQVIIPAPENVKITPSESTKAAAPNTSVSFDVNYSAEPAETPTTGIAFRMHWDSSQVAFDPVTGLTNRFSLGAQPTNVVEDDPVTNGGLDGDPNTDKYILQTWIDANGNWPNISNPTLYTANFTTLPDFEGTKINFSPDPDNLPNFVSSSIALTSSLSTQDIDGNGVIDVLTDGIIVIRYILGFSGETLIKGASGEGASRDSEKIVTYLDEVRDRDILDIDGNGRVETNDGILFLRYAFGFGGDALIEDAISPNATRTIEPAILEHLQSF